jgi:hypothetical protein
MAAKGHGQKGQFHDVWKREWSKKKISALLASGVINKNSFSMAERGWRGQNSQFQQDWKRREVKKSI